MLNRFKVENFGVLENFEISNLKQINLISGETGKTTFLGALEVFADKPYYNIKLKVFEGKTQGLKYKNDCIILADCFLCSVHHSKLQKVWSDTIDHIIKYRQQLFAVVYSYEVLQAFYKVSKQKDFKDYSFYRFEKDDEGKIKAVYLDHEAFEGAMEIGLEIR